MTLWSTTNGAFFLAEHNRRRRRIEIDKKRKKVARRSQHFNISHSIFINNDYHKHISHLVVSGAERGDNGVDHINSLCSLWGMAPWRLRGNEKALLLKTKYVLINIDIDIATAVATENSPEKKTNKERTKKLEFYLNCPENTFEMLTNYFFSLSVGLSS